MRISNNSKAIAATVAFYNNSRVSVPHELAAALNSPQLTKGKSSQSSVLARKDRARRRKEQRTRQKQLLNDKLNFFCFSSISSSFLHRSQFTVVSLLGHTNPVVIRPPPRLLVPSNTDKWEETNSQPSWLWNLLLGKLKVLQLNPPSLADSAILQNPWHDPQAAWAGGANATAVFPLAAEERDEKTKVAFCERHFQGFIVEPRVDHFSGRGGVRELYRFTVPPR